MGCGASKKRDPSAYTQWSTDKDKEGTTGNRWSTAQRASGYNAPRKPMFSNKPPPGPDLVDGKLAEHEIQKRTEAIDATRSFEISDDVTIRYAYVSQRGYYPASPHNSNQDAYSVTVPFGGLDRDAFLVVYDGHGRYGDLCAKFASEALPAILEKKVRVARRAKGRDEDDVKDWPMLSEEEFRKCSVKAHVECNEAMHNAEDVYDKDSGTTAISAAFHNGKVTISNVGDSRAIVGRMVKEENETEDGEKDGEGGEGTEGDADNNGGGATTKLKGVALSQDQTPYRRDERERIRKTGARVLTVDQIDGNASVADSIKEVDLGNIIDDGGDPPRVWAKDEAYPGCAFTRSIGDSGADELGVIPEPEMTSLTLTPDDRMIILASDGVFEFLTNQSVIDICAEFDDPLEAARKLVRESYEKWIGREERTDDITAICMFIDFANDGT